VAKENEGHLILGQPIMFIQVKVIRSSSQHIDLAILQSEIKLEKPIPVSSGGWV
jgi:hypothetical protein